MIETQALRGRLVALLQEKGVLQSERAAAAFAVVPRHAFLPGEPLGEVYADRVFVIKTVDQVRVSSASQPSAMAIMLEQLDVQPGQRVLEVGTGTGYNAALLSYLVGVHGRVTTIDIDPELAEIARQHLQSTGYDAVTVLAADGALGHEAGAPYDRIIVTASCGQIPQPVIDQLVEGGSLVLPLRVNGLQACFAFRKQRGAMISRQAAPLRAVPLQGAFGHAYTYKMLSQELRIGWDSEFDDRHLASLAQLLQNGRELPWADICDSQRSPIWYLILQGVQALRLQWRKDSEWDHLSDALTFVFSGESAAMLRGGSQTDAVVTVFGNDEVVNFFRAALGRWKKEGEPELRDLQARLEPATTTLGPLPRHVDGYYHLTLGRHLYLLWFDR